MKNNIMTHALALVGASTFLIASNVAMAGGYSQANLPAAVQVPAGNEVAMYTNAKGNITWECKADQKNSGNAKWAFAGPRAILTDAKGNQVVSYFGPPATWEALDGSAVTGKQLAVSPSAKGSIPMQLVKANPANRDGMMSGVTYIQRINLKGGAAPATGCSTDKIGHKIVVNYAGDYVFYKAK